jgi:hypothetical protein
MKIPFEDLLIGMDVAEPWFENVLKCLFTMRRQ